jgi:hypothetical protein
MQNLSEQAAQLDKTLPPESSPVNLDDYKPVEEHLLSFNIAGLKYYEYLQVVELIQVGSILQIVHEKNNIYDPKAVVVFFRGKKLGYIPKEENEFVSKLLSSGNGDILSTKVQSKKIDGRIESQLSASISLKVK